MAGTPVLLRDIPVAVGGDVGHILARARLVQLPAPEPFPEHRPLVLGDGSLDLQEQLVVRVVADGVLDEDDLAATPPQLVEDERLVGILTGQPVGGENGDEAEGPRLGVVPQAVEGRAIEAGATVPPVTIMVFISEMVPLLPDPGGQDGDLALDRLLQVLALRRNPGVNRGFQEVPPSRQRQARPAVLARDRLTAGRRPGRGAVDHRERGRRRTGCSRLRAG